MVLNRIFSSLAAAPGKCPCFLLKKRCNAPLATSMKSDYECALCNKKLRAPEPSFRRSEFCPSRSCAGARVPYIRVPAGPTRLHPQGKGGSRRGISKTSKNKKIHSHLKTLHPIHPDNSNSQLQLSKSSRPEIGTTSNTQDRVFTKDAKQQER